MAAILVKQQRMWGKNMNTPIYDFVKDYVSKDPVRLHMPGHKGVSAIDGADAEENAYKYDITEIDGADYLLAPSGIIAESEANAGKLFGCHTLYSTEGSSLCIRAMMFLVKKYARSKGHEPLILAGRNAHASFVNAAALLDINVEWIMQKESDSYESCSITGEDIEKVIKGYLNTEYLIKKLPDAVYITSPDYLGNMSDIKELADVCHKYGLLLLVDNAHGAYLKFLEESLHPVDFGADICCDSAHKTLPVLTGGAYLHIASEDTKDVSVDQAAKDKRKFIAQNARQALSVFATTSPSYLTLQSLDKCNAYLENNKSIKETAEKVASLKKKLLENKYLLIGNEPLKITVGFNKESTLCSGLTDKLKENGIYAEYQDREHIVMMFSGSTTEEDFQKVQKVLTMFAEENKDALNAQNDGKKAAGPDNKRKKAPNKSMSFKDAMLAQSEQVDAENSIGRILAQPVLSCPPCVPVYMCGEVIGEEILKYCTGKVTVVKRSR